MNIIEAIKSGKRFKRKDCSTWFDYHDNYRFASYEILAEDWEVEEEVSITSSLFDSKAIVVLSRWQYNTLDNTPNIVELALADLKKELGL